MVKECSGKFPDGNANFPLRYVEGRTGLNLRYKAGVSDLGLRRTIVSKKISLAVVIDDGVLS